VAPRPSRFGGNGPFTTIIVLLFFILISPTVAAKPYTPCPFWKKKSFFPFILEENYRKERKNKINFFSYYIFLFGNFRLEM
jgi:hypothetical protein